MGSTHRSAIHVECSIDKIIAEATVDLSLSPLPAILPHQGQPDVEELPEEVRGSVGDVRSDESGMDGAGSNPVRRPLLGQRLGEHDVGQLRVVVGLKFSDHEIFLLVSEHHFPKWTNTSSLIERNSQ